MHGGFGLDRMYTPFPRGWAAVSADKDKLEDVVAGRIEGRS